MSQGMLHALSLAELEDDDDEDDDRWAYRLRSLTEKIQHIPTSDRFR